MDTLELMQREIKIAFSKGYSAYKPGVITLCPFAEGSIGCAPWVDGYETAKRKDVQKNPFYPTVTTAFWEGHAAYMISIPRSDCAYEVGTIELHAWLTGYQKAEREAQEINRLATRGPELPEVNIDIPMPEAKPPRKVTVKTIAPDPRTAPEALTREALIAYMREDPSHAIATLEAVGDFLGGLGCFVTSGLVKAIASDPEFAKLLRKST